MRRPRLTPKVIDGLLEVQIHAQADLESMSGDEGRDPEDLKNMGIALEYIRNLRAWYRNQRKANP